MNIVNAIAKVRFSAAKPQRVQLHKGGGLSAELLCMEAGQEFKASARDNVYYVIIGTAAFKAGVETTPVAAGQLAIPGDEETYTIANAAEGRLVCLAIRPAR